MKGKRMNALEHRHSGLKIESEFRRSSFWSALEQFCEPPPDVHLSSTSIVACVCVRCLAIGPCDAEAQRRLMKHVQNHLTCCIHAAATVGRKVCMQRWHRQEHPW
eukprot:1160947-Pelagomonas_calceolata.AAC.5